MSEDATLAAVLGDMLGALGQIVHLTHNRNDLTSRQVNKIAFSTLARVAAALPPPEAI